MPTIACSEDLLMICKSFIPCVTVLGLWTGSAAAQAPESSKDKATQEEKIVIGGKEFAIIPAEKLRAHGFDVPQIPRERNAFWVYVEAINAAKDVPPDLRDAFEPLSRGGIWPEGDTGERLAAWLKENKPAIDLVRRATAMPDYALPPMASPGADVTVSSILLPILSPERQLARLLAGEAAALHAHGQSDAAMENYLTMQRMGNQIASGNLLIECLVGMAINSLAE